MKDYRPGRWGVAFIFSLEGSVIPRALCAALPNACLAVGIWYFWRKVIDEEMFEDAQMNVDIGQVWTGYNWVLGFTVAFRTQRAYSRWWEGGTLLQQARGEWFNAYSSLIAFCAQVDSKRGEVAKFQQTLARLMSMLYASALMSIATEPDLDFEIIDISGMNEGHLEYLRTQPDKCEIIMQWIQRLIVDNMGGGTLPIPPPVISRVFQELSRGIVNIHNVRKITEFQFPFPAAQMIVLMLMVQWVLTPIVTGLFVGSPAWAFVLCFVPIFACWGINYLAGELEQPFGIDYNDMPLHFMQASMNTSILALLDIESQTPPDFDMTQKRLQNDMIDPGKACVNIQNLQPMRSVRCVTIADPSQLNRVKHKYTAGRDSNLEQQQRFSGMFQKSSTKDLNKPELQKRNTKGFSPEESNNYSSSDQRSERFSNRSIGQGPVMVRWNSLCSTSSMRYGSSDAPARQLSFVQEQRESITQSMALDSMGPDDRAPLRVTGIANHNSESVISETEELSGVTVTQAVPIARYPSSDHPHALPCFELPPETHPSEVKHGSEGRSSHGPGERRKENEDGSRIDRDPQVAPGLSLTPMLR